METVNQTISIASCIDHTVLKPVATKADTARCAAEALTHGFAAVCIPPFSVAATARALRGSKVKTATVIGFPMGYAVTTAKLEECRVAMAEGAEELDVVINLMALKSGDWDYVRSEIQRLTDAIHAEGQVIKVIVESGILTTEELLRCCRELGPLGIDFMKTSTGYAEKGASVEAVALMRRELPPSVAIKASGGIRTYEFARQLVNAGATRIACSGSLQLLAEEKASLLTETHT